jgi:hypothetical protein
MLAVGRPGESHDGRGGVDAERARAIFGGVHGGHGAVVRAGPDRPHVALPHRAGAHRGDGPEPGVRRDVAARRHLRPPPERPPDVRAGGGAREGDQRPAAGSSPRRLRRGGQGGGEERRRGVQERADEAGGQGQRRCAAGGAAGVLEHLQGRPPDVQGGGRLCVDQGDDARGQRGGARAAGLAAGREDRIPGGKR